MYQLQRSDLKSSVWKRFEKGLAERLQELRESNDSIANDEIKTALIRGQIRMVHELLALSQDSARADDFPSDGEVDP